jgi:hypothetical protein
LMPLATKDVRSGSSYRRLDRETVNKLTGC